MPGEASLLVAETAARIFADFADPQTINRAADDSWKTQLWNALDKSLAANEPALIEVPVGDMPSPWPFIDLPKVRGA